MERVVAGSVLEGHIPRIFQIDSYRVDVELSLIHISEPTRRVVISYAVFCLKNWI